jgi:hypothetical protein
MADPIKVLELSKAEDPFHRQHAEVLEAWHNLYRDRVVQVREILKLVDDFTHTAAEAAFVEVVKDIAPPRGFSGKYFAGWLRRHKGRVVGGLRLDVGDVARYEAGWKVGRQS